MRHQLIQLGRNVRGGVRLALFMPVERLAFRIGVAELLLLFVLSAALDFASDWLRYAPEAYFSLHGAGSELFSAGLLLLTSTVLALAYRQQTLVVALPVIALSTTVIVQAVQLAYDAGGRWWPAVIRAIPIDVQSVVLVWLVAALIRATAVALVSPGRLRWLRAVVGGVLLAAPLWIAPELTPTEPWWQQPSSPGGVDARYPNPASEPVLTTQATLLDDALSNLDDERPGTTDLYYVGFGGYANADAFRKDVEAAQAVMDDRWDTKGRSITLLNNPRTLLETPLATVTNLRETLGEIAGAMNTDEDVAMIYLASHGERGSLAVSLPPLELTPLTPAVLRNLLDEAGITWRIVIISSCYSGSFIPELEEEHTMVITASQADRTSFGCGLRSESTYFGQAFFQEGLAKADSFPAAFEVAQKAIAERELREGFSPPSNPQIFIGSAMADKLKELERGSAARRSGRLVCDGCGKSRSDGQVNRPHAHGSTGS